MPAAPIPVHELKRVAAVQKTRLLGTPAEERFDQITRLARRMFNVPMAIIDIVGEKLAWLKSVQGFDRFEVAREHSYCHYTVLNEEPCLIHDARVDPRVSDNPFAASFVFYAGVPLKFQGQNVGVLCIADSEPREIGEGELDALRDLAALAERELEVGALSEIQLALAASNEELEMKARIDVLTRVWNRRGIVEIAEREVEQANGTQTNVGLALIDIDHFKAVNDTYGHAAGDEVLRVVSQRLRAVSRPTDAVGRYGGEEFLAVMPQVDADSFARVCDRLRLALWEQPIDIGAASIQVSCSIGGVISYGAKSLDALLRRADTELYRAKHGGRNRLEIDTSGQAADDARPLVSAPH